MPDYVSIFISALGLAFVFTFMPGSVSAEAMRRGLHFGYVPALLVLLGSALGSLPWIALSFSGAMIVLEHGAVWRVLHLAGAALLFKLAISTLVMSRERQELSLGPGSRNACLTGAMLTITSPLALAFFGGVVTGTLATHRDTGAAPVVLLVVGFLASAIVFSLVLAWMITQGARWLRAGATRWVDGICGLFLAVTGLRLVWSAI